MQCSRKVATFSWSSAFDAPASSLTASEPSFHAKAASSTALLRSGRRVRHYDHHPENCHDRVLFDDDDRVDPHPRQGGPGFRRRGGRALRKPARAQAGNGLAARSARFSANSLQDPLAGKIFCPAHGQGIWLKQLISRRIVAQSGAISGLKWRNFPGFFPGGREFARVGTTAITPTAQSRAAFIRR
jgi:hypothetical protein